MCPNWLIARYGTMNAWCGGSLTVNKQVLEGHMEKSEEEQKEVKG